MMKKFLFPDKHKRIIDLVEQTGIDISDWSNFKGGPKKASSNPKYCYDWSFVDDKNKIIVLCIWYEGIESVNKQLLYKFNARKTAENETGARKKRAFNMDFALQKALREELPLRVVICDSGKFESGAGSRLLDEDNWHISSYDNDGNCCLLRGIKPRKVVDQFEIDDSEEKSPIKKTVSSQIFERSPQIRKSVLARACGYCELCGEKGFVSSSGAIYLESHHIVPLSEEGADSINNVIALCPNHHREAHYGKEKENIKSKLLKIISDVRY